jgi:cell division protein FtsB
MKLGDLIISYDDLKALRDENARLHARNAMLETTMKEDEAYHRVRAEVLALRAENERLRAALQTAREALRLPEWPSKITRNDAIVEIDDALKAAPQ